MVSVPSESTAARRSSRVIARLWVALGAGLGTLFSAATVTLYRQGLRYGCSLLQMGDSEPEWACSDGIGYLIPAASAAASAMLFSLIGVIALGARRSPRVAGLILTAIAAACVGVAAWSTATSATQFSWPSGEDRWLALIAPSIAIAAGALLVATAALLLRNARVAWALSTVGAVVMLGAAVLQLGIGAFLLPAAALLAAATVCRREELREHASRAMPSASPPLG